MTISSTNKYIKHKMDENTMNNKIVENNVKEIFEFKYNFVNTPWDDRSKKNKIGIVALLVAIFVVTMACVINNFVMHYREYEIVKNSTNTEISCIRVKIEEYPFVARIHSASSKKLLCIGAVVSLTSILAGGVCVKSGPIRVYLGSPSQPYCKKGFTVDVIQTLYHSGTISKKLILLSSYEDNIAKCSTAVKIHKDLHWDSRAYIIGRPLNLERSFSRQHVTLVKKDDIPAGFNMRHMKMGSMICVKDLARCPVGASDLLVQNDKLYGISATSVHRSDEDLIACFADLSMVWTELKKLDRGIYE